MLKTIAIWSVVLCHVVAAPFSGGIIGTTPWYSALLWASLTYMCVPLFFMASGALLLKPERELTLKKLYTKNLARILAALFFWALCYKLVSLKLMDSLTLPDVVDAVKHLLLFHHEEHFYYLHILGNRLCVLCRGPAERTLFRGNGLVYVPGRFRGMGLLSDSLSFTNRPKADRFYLKSLLLRLSYAHFLPPSLCAMGSPGRRRAGAADGAADFGADYLLLLCRLFSPVPDSGCPALADIAV